MRSFQKVFAAFARLAHLQLTTAKTNVVEHVLYMYIFPDAEHPPVHKDSVKGCMRGDPGGFFPARRT